ncbi:MAG: tRNA threonylcarbamoyladenosine biosynthesis protein RimN [Gammaproteobacteria bacterium]|nr:tRNA threonylcarbamoyladenosine biosynthesis protein RimN [Gammaproteobacteria bacterium]
MTSSIHHAAKILMQGGLIAYPTEAVFGLGCLPDRHDTIQRLLELKKRPKEKGLILLASDLSQLSPYLSPIEPEILKKINASWPGPTTWILPTPKETSPLIRGIFETIAVRISAHPVVRELCTLCQSALISTSANISGESMSYTAHDVRQHFDNHLDYILDEALGNSKNPSTIKNALTDQVIRS